MANAALPATCSHRQQLGELTEVQPARIRAVDRPHHPRIEEIHIQVQPVAPKAA